MDYALQSHFRLHAANTSFPKRLLTSTKGNRLKEPEETAVAFFNYAHSYAVSAVTLEDYPTEASHDDAPISFLFYHAIELYLKSHLIVHGWQLEKLRKKSGHKICRPANEAETNGLTIEREDREVFLMMFDPDNVITSRYIRVGHHRRLPRSAHFDTCKRLQGQIGLRAHRDSGVFRIPILRDKRQITELS
ncbi:MAG: hypothetical protein AAFP13_03640 [Pseudomonadota bacterium]